MLKVKRVTQQALMAILIVGILKVRTTLMRIKNPFQKFSEKKVTMILLQQIAYPTKKWFSMVS